MATGQEKDWIDIGTALLTPVIAIGVATVATGQFWLARHKFKLDLFDRRWAVYSATRELVAHVFTKASVSDEVLHRFLQGIRGAAWLFDETVEAYLRRELWAKVCALQAAVSVIEHGAGSPDYQRSIKAKTEIMLWIVEQDAVIDALFAPFMRVDEAFWTWVTAPFRRRQR